VKRVGDSRFGEERYQGDARFLEWQKERARRVEKTNRRFARTPIAGPASTLPVDELERAHDTDDHYSVLPGHVMPEFERVLEKHERHWVVEKFTPQEVEDRLVTDTKTQ
jgi:hypothetical protein